MGNYILDGNKQSQPSEKLVNMIGQIKRKLKLDNLMKSCITYVENIHPITKLSFEKFDDVFCNELNNTKPLFQILE